MTTAPLHARPAHAGHRSRALVAAAALMAFMALAPAAGWAGAVEDAIETRIARLSDRGALAIDSSEIAAISLLPDLYERRGYRAAWDRPQKLDALLSAIEDAALDGLVPDDYHLTTLRQRRAAMAGGNRSASETAETDLLASDALVRLTYHLFFGKVDPVRLDSRWNFTRPIDREDAVGSLNETLESGRIGALLERARPSRAIYMDLRRALAAHRDLAARGGWPRIPAGAALKSGVRDPRVAVLRARLAASGDLEGSTFGARRAAHADTSQLFDPALERAVKTFQLHHRLAPDGAVGPGTLAAMNVPVEERIDQLRVNLERGRWLLHQLPDSFVVVNVAAFETYLVVGNQSAWTSRCQVGKQARQTPIFRSDMRYIVINPTWTVPPGILAKDILPSLQRGDLSVLQRKKLDVFDAQGRAVSPKSVAWSRVSARNCPYTFRQDAGPDNALGRVKFMFPNSYSVYLHDTPSKDLFEAPSRAFSSGCIRVDRPLELAERVLADPKWNAAAIAKTVESGKTTTVSLKRPLPVLLLYWTAFPVGGGTTSFAPDIYARDPGILKALGGRVRLGKRSVMVAGGATQN